jgi:hypothetical protein
VATDVRLWLRGEIDTLLPLLGAMQTALGRMSLQGIRSCLVRAAEVDRIGKGLAPGDPWDALWGLCVAVATGTVLPSNLSH